MYRRHKKRLFWAAPLITAMTLSWPSQAQEAVEDRPRLIEVPDLLPQERFRQCLLQAEHAPMAALIDAERWETDGGGNLARECAATALANNGDDDLAARRFETLARDLAQIDADYAAGLFREAGRLWLRADVPQRAVFALEAAGAIAEPDPQLLVQRARAREALDDHEGALEDLQEATDLAPDRPDLLALRASLLHRLDRSDAAIEDLTRAIDLGGDFAELTLERGIVRARQGDSAGARRDFQAVLDEAPDSVAAEIARREINLLDGPG